MVNDMRYTVTELRRQKNTGVLFFAEHKTGTSRFPLTGFLCVNTKRTTPNRSNPIAQAHKLRTQTTSPLHYWIIEHTGGMVSLSTQGVRHVHYDQHH